ncbi:haloacid dehalogenase superfamily, subfamily IA, variant 3 with third motif having DD or ED/haloacid dehalogenase superfamily, subfamily IA, variant 1 with third motif having Dx(3-4)D or Dx(3-4)E/beta-phosphoglucomutase family hydrolase [Chitinophaga jiangningensis]|uniref:Beta-phosphoglucomutase n=1 Tax=Chitinophaga jiangningensis TaxID=1419482 RepID=A0A1M7BPN4_9BACT|nr:HAD family phosphatase [Chitinophaga jiangningensis]SHL57025.1 haloacid dehalogenase superfamily, subfamily IA, variant 3 with third motif having DD or ED/haloacid dehalogenase superfamily, subfamily IA, variant 1 with third motif having Dx(3-4)D or Dx(3-4)E/beta-phosphoglucomutase family hydrolase [Chitinophaga jiangningensis]
MAFIFDMNGTMINDMEYHLDGWFDMLNKLGANMTREQVRGHMYGKNEELLERIFGKGHFTPEEMATYARRKEEIYQAAFRPHLQLIAGLPAFLEKATAQQIPMAIGTAADKFNVDYVLDNLDLRHYFKAIIGAEDVSSSKPNPEVFLKAAEALGVPAANCIVFEDAPKGVEAAANAGMKAVAITSMHTRDEFDQYDNIIAFVDDYNDPVLAQLFS